jgi:hypothetical protein
MTKYKLEYIWLDGYTPTPNLRGKTQIKEFDALPTLEQLPLWGFDGSSTLQAEGHSSDCVLKPVRIVPDITRANGAVVLCEVLMPDLTPHPSNKRATILDDGAHGSASSRSISSTRTAVRWASRTPATRPRRARTTPVSATARWATSRARSSRSTSISALQPG